MALLALIVAGSAASSQATRVRLTDAHTRAGLPKGTVVLVVAEEALEGKGRPLGPSEEISAAAARVDTITSDSGYLAATYDRADRKRLLFFAEVSGTPLTSLKAADPTVAWFHTITNPPVFVMGKVAFNDAALRSALRSRQGAPASELPSPSATPAVQSALPSDTPTAQSVMPSSAAGARQFTLPIWLLIVGQVACLVLLFVRTKRHTGMTEAENLLGQIRAVKEEVQRRSPPSVGQIEVAVKSVVQDQLMPLIVDANRTAKDSLEKARNIEGKVDALLRSKDPKNQQRTGNDVGTGGVGSYVAADPAAAVRERLATLYLGWCRSGSSIFDPNRFAETLASGFPGARVQPLFRDRDSLQNAYLPTREGNDPWEFWLATIDGFSFLLPKPEPAGALRGGEAYSGSATPESLGTFVAATAASAPNGAWTVTSKGTLG